MLLKQIHTESKSLEALLDLKAPSSDQTLAGVRYAESFEIRSLGRDLHMSMFIHRYILSIFLLKGITFACLESHLISFCSSRIVDQSCVSANISPILGAADSEGIASINQAVHNPSLVDIAVRSCCFARYKVRGWMSSIGPSRPCY